MYPPRPRVTITHKPSGISAYCHECRTNKENHEKALKLLKSRLWVAQQIQVDSGDISVEYFEGEKP